ncbi:MAG: tetratricopeptide repeat protein [Pseudomonadota bacterium]
MQSLVAFPLIGVLVLVGLARAHAHDAVPTGPAHDLAHGAELVLDGQPSAALPLLEASVAGFEAARDSGEDLVTALGYLGAAHHRLGDHQRALTLLGRARQLAQEREGEYNRTQLPLVYVEAESLRALGRLDEAEARQQLAVELVRRHHGEDSTEAALALGRLGEWHYGLASYDEALLLFSTAIEKAEAVGDPTALLPLLQGMAVTQLAARRAPKRALDLLARVVDLTDQGDGFNTDTRIEARLLYGNLLMRFSRERDALAAYREAWSIAHDAGDQAWLARLAEAGAAAGRLNPVAEIPDERVYFVFRYDLGADGRPSRVRLLESNTSATKADWARTSFREMRFRPPMVDGEPQSLASVSGIFVY